ncbi:MAG: galactokinase [Pirellulales bacterium]|nr:galactokinase [Pirellulales bacterium]
MGPEAPRHAYFVPGRIEVLGKHTDYAGGRTMVAVAERGFCLAASPRQDRRIRVCDAACGDTVEFNLDPELVPRAGHWSNYPMTVARRVARNFPGIERGADIALASDLPPAAGMSSSSAMMVATWLALAEVNALEDRPEFRENIMDLTDLAGYLGTVENGQTFGSLVGDRGVGTFGGSEDHTAILNARPGHVSQYSYCPVRFERLLPVPSGYTFAIGSSGVAAEKTGSAMEKYNRASRLLSKITELWREATGCDDRYLAAALASGPEAVGRLTQIVQHARPGEMDPKALLTRLEHFLTENEQILPAAGDALARGDLARFGELVDRSQLASEQLLGNQVPETVYLALSARSAGAVAASAFGAGFGGSVWALIEAAAADAFLDKWIQAYREQFPEQARAAVFFTTAAGPAAFRVT